MHLATPQFVVASPPPLTYVILSIFACEDAETITSPIRKTRAVTVGRDTNQLFSISIAQLVVESLAASPTAEMKMPKPPEAPADAPGLTEEEMRVSKTKRMTDKAINKLYQQYLKGDVDPEVFATQLAGWLGYWVQDDPHLQISYAFLTEVADNIVGGELGPTMKFAKTIQRKFIGHCLNFHPESLIESKVRLESMPLLKWVDSVDYEICLGLLEGKKLKEIAQSMKMTQDAIRKRVQRMREKRKKFVQQGTAKTNVVLASPVGGLPYSDWKDDYEQAANRVRPPDEFQIHCGCTVTVAEDSGNRGAGNAGKARVSKPSIQAVVSSPRCFLRAHRLIVSKTPASGISVL